VRVIVKGELMIHETLAPGIEIYNADCLDVMREMEDGSVDLTITSPPYDDLRNYDGYVFDFESIAVQLFRITKAGGVVVWVVNDMTIDGGESGTSFRQALKFMDIGFTLHDTMIYQKSGASYPSQTRYYQTFEYMFILSKGTPKTINLLKDRKNEWYGQKWSKTRSRRTKDGDLKVQDWYVDEGDRYGVRFNVWKINGGAGYTAEEDYAYDHPAMFPEKLAGDHILSWSNEGDIVFDPMCGSGTTGKMAIKYQRRFTGIDISSGYYAIAKRRIQEALMQPRLL
jgi:DNA modification methylase